MTELNADTFSVARAVPVAMVTFYAPWCQHCKEMLPALEELAERARAGHAPVVVARMDAASGEPEKKLAAELGVDKFPTTVLYVKGAPAATIIGARSANELEERLNEHVDAWRHKRDVELAHEEL